MWKKTIKYLLNFAGISLMIFYANVGFGIIVKLPDCENIEKAIWNVVGELCKIYLVYLLIITAINILFEKKIEKKSNSKEFLLLTVINIVILVLITNYFSNEFYKICCGGK